MSHVRPSRFGQKASPYGSDPSMKYASASFHGCTRQDAPIYSCKSPVCFPLLGGKSGERQSKAFETMPRAFVWNVPRFVSPELQF